MVEFNNSRRIPTMDISAITISMNNNLLRDPIRFFRLFGMKPIMQGIDETDITKTIIVLEIDSKTEYNGLYYFGEVSHGEYEIREKPF